MKSLDDAVAAVVRALDFDEAEIARRKDFLEFTAEDIALLSELHGTLHTLAPDFANAFYDHLLAFEETRRFIPDMRLLARIKQTHAAYFESLTAGEYGSEYIANRLRVGVTHQRIGLEPKWYLGAYSKYLGELLPEIWQRLGKDPESFIAAYRALIKVVLLDMGLAIDTYIQADRQTILTLKEYADMVFASIPNGLLVLSSELVILSANRSFLKQLGLTAEAVHSRHLMDVIAVDGLRERILEVLSTGVAQHGIFFSMGSAESNARKPVRITLTGIRLAEEEEEEEEEARLLLIIEDLTAEEKLRTAALESERRFRDLAETANDGIIMVDMQGKIAYFNRSAEQMFGYYRNQILGQLVKALIPNIDSHLHESGKASLSSWEIEGFRRDGSIFPVEGSSSVFEGSMGRFVTYVLRDLSERKRAEGLIWKQANFDSLTGLPNRHMFHDRMEQEIRKAHRAGLPLALMFIDLDGFKEVNDTLGHSVGDILLNEAAQRLIECVRESDTVARLGGDEFTIILGELADLGGVERIAQAILQKLAAPFQLGIETVYISASIGITLYPNDATGIEELLKNADQAMYAAKNQGRNRFSYFTQSMQESAQARMRLARDLRGALADRQFLMVYQPIVELATGAIHKAEALIRWQHPTRGLVSPAEFISIAEETEIIIDIGDWVFREAARQAAIWRTLHHAQFQISINTSPAQYRNDGIKHYAWFDHLKELGLPGQSIVVEITEGLLLDASAAITDQLLAFRDAGIQVSLDDFGTGYSSLSYLKKFDIDYLKIDQSFVRNLAANSDDMALCEAIIMMAHKLGLKVIAEGVETKEQRGLLAAAGCDYGQGYLFSGPVSAEQFEALLV
ncbi:MAG: EAL domain-containing protein [Gammaproteobacteria bacterium]|nr:EAL domain-containing protein [Gammaproteobacteria bacterium]